MLLLLVQSAVYTSTEFRSLVKQLGVFQSMGAIGSLADNSLADNALAESFIEALNRELLDAADAFPDASTAYRAMCWWDKRCNR